MDTSSILTLDNGVVFCFLLLQDVFPLQTSQRIVYQSYQMPNRSPKTSILGIYFTALQAYEYIETLFSISDSVCGTTFL